MLGLRKGKGQQEGSKHRSSGHRNLLSVGTGETNLSGSERSVAGSRDLESLTSDLTAGQPFLGKNKKKKKRGVWIHLTHGSVRM